MPDRAEHPAHGQVALKVLKDKLRGDRTAVARAISGAELGRMPQADRTRYAEAAAARAEEQRKAEAFVRDRLRELGQRDFSLRTG